MLSIPHLIIIFVIVLIAVGPEKMPQLARTLGKAMAEFRKITGDLRRVVDDEMRELDRQAREMEIRKRDEAAQAALAGTNTPAVPVLTGAPPVSPVIEPPAIETQPQADLDPIPQRSIAPPGTIATEPPHVIAGENTETDSNSAIPSTAPSAIDPHEPTSDAQSKPA